MVLDRLNIVKKRLSNTVASMELEPLTNSATTMTLGCQRTASEQTSPIGIPMGDLERTHKVHLYNIKYKRISYIRLQSLVENGN